MIYLSPSKLETFRLYYTEAWNGYITKDRVIASIKGEQEFSGPALRGSSFHKLIEDDPEKYAKIDLIKYDAPFEDGQKQYWEVPNSAGEVNIFGPLEVASAIEYKNEIPGASHEVRYRWMYRDNVCIRMIIDVIWGDFIDDVKTSEKPKKYSDFEDSLQWKIYCLALELPIFRYQIFQFKNGKGEYNGDIDRSTFVMLPTIPADLRADIDQYVDLLIDFCEDNNLMDYILREGNSWNKISHEESVFDSIEPEWTN